MSMDDQAAVHEAIENHRYNPEILPNLEAYVDYQVREIDDHDPNTPLSYKTVEAATLPPRPFLETASPLTAPPEHPSGTSLRAPPPVS